MKAYPLFFHDSFKLKLEKINRKGILKVKEKDINITTCAILDDSKKVLSIGIAVQSITDSYNRKTGNKIALARASATLQAKKNILPVKRDFAIAQLSKTFPELLISTMFKGMFNPTEESFKRFNVLIGKKKLTDKDSINV